MSKKYSLSMSVTELEYLRDIFSIYLDQETTISQRLSHLTERSSIEDSLWKKVYTLCEKSGVSVGDSAPNYIVSLSDCPIDIFKAEFQEPGENFLNNLTKENKNETESGSKDIPSSSKKDKNNTSDGNRRNNKKKSSR